MIKMKNGFTLSEVLITLTVVGVLAALVIPGLIKDTTNRAMIASLQGTVGNLTNAVQNELVRTGSKDISTTDIYLKPDEFLKNLNAIRTAKDGSLFPSVQYTNYNKGAFTANSCKASAMLKNGVRICHVDNDGPAYGKDMTNSKVWQQYLIDVNGPDGPNVSGLDLFGVVVYNTDTMNSHVGDVGGIYLDYIPSEEAEKHDAKKCKSNASSTSAFNCYLLLEQSGFDPKYLENEK